MLKYADEQMDIFRSSRLWEKYHQQCKMMNVHIIHLRHYLNKRRRAFPVLINRYGTDMTSTVILHKTKHR